MISITLNMSDLIYSNSLSKRVLQTEVSLGFCNTDGLNWSTFRSEQAFVKLEKTELSSTRSQTTTEKTLDPKVISSYDTMTSVPVFFGACRCPLAESGWCSIQSFSVLNCNKNIILRRGQEKCGPTTFLERRGQIFNTIQYKIISNRTIAAFKVIAHKKRERESDTRLISSKTNVIFFLLCNEKICLHCL